jgi:hypothetical protein
MTHKLLLFFSAIFLLAFHTANAAGTEIKTYFIPSDDVTIHCKVYGKGDPLILLHGAMVDMNDWEKQIPVLAAKYQVIAIDSRGHGQSTFTDRQLSYAIMADDVINVMDYLKVDSANFIGFSDGGIIAMLLAMNHPERVRKLVAIGVDLTPTPDAVYLYFLDKVKDWDVDKMVTQLKIRYKSYPNPELLPAFVKRMQYLLLHEPNWNLADMKAIKSPTLVIVSDYDLITVSHAFSMFENLPKAYLAVIPGARHYSIKDKPEILNAMFLDFLNKPYEKIERF